MRPDDQLEYSFGYWIKRRRKALDLTQAALANEVGCATITIKKIEADQRRPSRQMAVRIAEVLHIPEDEREKFLLVARSERSTQQLPAAAEELSLFDDKRVLEFPAYFKLFQTDTKQPWFVSREQELKFLETKLQQASAGNGQVVFISGEAGNGKSSLLHEFARRATSLNDSLLVTMGNCSAMTGIGDPYLPFRDAFSVLCGDLEPSIQSGFLTRENAERIWNTLPVIFTEILNKGQELVDIFVAHDHVTTIGRTHFGPRNDIFEDLVWTTQSKRIPTSNFEQIQILEQFTQVIQSIAKHHPVLILLDDLQWIDHASLGLLFHFGRRIENSQIMLVGAFRPSEITIGYGSLTPDQPASRHPLDEVIKEFRMKFNNLLIDLSESTTEEGREFIDALLDTEANQLSEQFREQLYNRTLGHPLFTVELLRDLQERNILRKDKENKWQIEGTINWGELPARVEAVIHQRLSRLDENLHQILSIGSIEGEIFTAQVVAHVLGKSELEILNSLSQVLEKKHHLVVEFSDLEEGATPITQFRFRHALFQHFIEKQLGSGEKRVMHLRIAQALEDLFQGNDPNAAVKLAHHFSEGGDHSKAVEYASLAAQKAIDGYAYEEAVQHLRSAISQLASSRDHTKKMELYEKIADAFVLNGERQQAIEHYTSAVNLLDENKSERDALTTIRLHRKIGETIIFMANFSDRQSFELLAQSSLNHGLEMVSGMAPHTEIAKLYTTLTYHALLPKHDADWEAAEEFAGLAVLTAEKLDNPDILAEALEALGNVYGVLGRYHERVQVALRRLSLSQLEQFKDKRQKSNILQQTGQAYIQVGTYSEALPLLEEAERIADSVLAVDQSYRALRYQSTVWHFLDRWDKVLEIDGKIRDLEQKIPNFSERVGPTCFQIGLAATAKAHLGATDESIQLQAQSVNMMIVNDGPKEGWGRDNLF